MKYVVGMIFVDVLNMIVVAMGSSIQSLPDEPLIFVEVALLHGLATKIADVIDAPIPSNDATDPFLPDTAIFYSITNCQAGLRGIPLGDFLLKQVIGELQATVPSLNQFSTLSPIPLVDEENIEFETSKDDLEKLTATYLLTAKEIINLVILLLVFIYEMAQNLILRFMTI